MDAKQVARGLAWFGIGLGVVEAVAPRALGRAAGLEDRAGLIRVFGAREIASGDVVLRSGEPDARLWIRVVGDMLDAMLLAYGMRSSNPRRKRTVVAALVVAPVVVLDVIYAMRARKRAKPGGEKPPEAPLDPLDGARTYVRYSDDVEEIASGEDETIEQILESMRRLTVRDREKYGMPVRVSHGKSHGIAVGELVVAEGLPDELRQGLFSRPASYSVIVRMSNVPGEVVRDSVNTQRGFAMKVLGVAGEMIAGHTGETTQDFVLDTGNRFPAPDAKAFLAIHSLLEHAPQLPDAFKATVSGAAHGANEILHAVGVDSANLDFFGHPRIHPLAEAYFSQAPIRYGDYIAKLAVVPVSAAQVALEQTKIDVEHDPDALRTATAGFLREHDAAFEVRVQLCTSLETMPVENANKEWPEEESPYRTVARLHIPRQEAYDPQRRAYVDEALSFSPAHSLAAHRPLGSIMRARLRAYPEMSRLRREAEGCPIGEPESIDAVPV